MDTINIFYLLALILVVMAIRKIQIRLRLSRAKHPSLRGHTRISRKVAKFIPFFEYGEDRFFCSDGAPDEIADKRRSGFYRLKDHFQTQSPQSIEWSSSLESSISDVLFTNSYRVPYPYRNYVKEHLKVGSVLVESEGTRVKDLDGNWSYDLFGSYGVNVFGYDFYKECMDEGIKRVRDFGPVLGMYHPVIAENVQKLKNISGLDEVSFHMSGTEAVMQAVRLARYHTGKSHLVRFCGAYHGWWDGVQPGIGNQRDTRDVYTLKDMDQDTLTVLRTRNDIACILINPLQALHPNGNAPSDAMLVNSSRSAHFDRQAYTEWLQELRTVCTERSIVMIMDEVFVGFRLAYRGAQEYFNVNADIVTYGKSLGGGFPVGVVCGKHSLMKRFRENRPMDICFARGTFNSHPYIMGTMNEFLRRIEDPKILNSYEDNDQIWNERVQQLNMELQQNQLPVQIANLSSIMTVLYTLPCRYNWMFQYYLRAEELALSWIGSGRFIMSHNYSDQDFQNVKERFIQAATAMKNDGWWWHHPELNNRSIQKQIFRDMLTYRFRFIF